MMKFYRFLIFGLFGLAFQLMSIVYAQNTLTIEAAIQQAIQNRKSTQISQLDIEQSRAELKSAYHVLFPRLTAGLDLKDNLVRPTTILPGALLGNPNGDGVPVQFGTTYNATGFLDLNYPIVDFTLGKNFELAKLNLSLAELQASNNENQIRKEVVVAYYAVLINVERQNQIGEELTTARAFREEMEERVKSGLANSIEAEQLLNQEKQIEIEAEQQAKVYELSVMRLNLALGNDLKKELEISPGIENLLENQSKDEQNIDLERLLTTKIADTQMRMAEVEKDKLNRGLLPVISLYGYLGAQGFGNSLSLFDKDRFPWYGVSYIGLRASLPINAFFDHKSNSIQQEIKIQKAALQVEDSKQQIDFQLEQTANQEMQARLELAKATEQLNFAKKKLDFVGVRVRTGQARSEDLVAAMTDDSSAKIALLIAKYNLAQTIWTQRILKEQF